MYLFDSDLGLKPGSCLKILPTKVVVSVELVETRQELNKSLFGWVTRLSLRSIGGSCVSALIAVLVLQPLAVLK